MNSAVAIDRRPTDLRLYSLLSLMVLFWAMNFIVGKIALRGFPALLLSAFRMTLAGLLILPVYLNTRRNGGPAYSSTVRKDLPALVLLGCLGVALNQICFVVGLSRTSAAHSALIIGLTPLLVLLLAAARGQETVTARKAAGLLVALCGVAVLQLAPHKNTSATPIGDLFIFGSAVAFALFTVFGKQFTTRIDGITMNTVAYVGSATLLLPFTVVKGLHFDYGRVNVTHWLALGYMAVFASLTSYLIYYYALNYIPASRVSAFSYLQPLLVTLMAVPALGERITTTVAGGGALVLAGIFLTERG